jgi:hypothetical protein
MMIYGMADRETRKLGGEGFAVCSKDLVAWVFTPVLGKCGVRVERGCHFIFRYRAHFRMAVVMLSEVSIRGSECLIILLVCLEVAIALRMMRPTSSDFRRVGVVDFIM